VADGWLDCFRVENKTLYRTFLGVQFPYGLVGTIETEHPDWACPCNRCSNSRAQTTSVRLLWHNDLCFRWYLGLVRDADHPGQRQLRLHLWWFVRPGKGSQFASVPSFLIHE
jgi:hypothetical protein